jgi:hypothetical protein
LLVHSSQIIVMWGRKENKFYSLMHFPTRQHTLKEYGILCTCTPKKKWEVWSWEQYVGITWEKN